MKYIQIKLKPGKDESLRRFHPWVFSGAIQSMTGQPEEGDIVEVCNNRGEFIALGHYQIGSITVRILTFEKENIDLEFYKTRLRAAYDVRYSVGLIEEGYNNTYRLVHGEGDYLPGLIIDIYDKTAVMQAGYALRPTPFGTGSARSHGRIVEKRILQVGNDPTL